MGSWSYPPAKYIMTESLWREFTIIRLFIFEKSCSFALFPIIETICCSKIIWSFRILSLQWNDSVLFLSYSYHSYPCHQLVNSLNFDEIHARSAWLLDYKILLRSSGEHKHKNETRMDISHLTILLFSLSTQPFAFYLWIRMRSLSHCYWTQHLRMSSWVV